MLNIQFGEEIESISRLKERIWTVPRKEKVIPISEQERAIIVTQLLEKLDWKERAKINLGLCALPEAPKTRKIITGESKPIYIIKIIENTGEKNIWGHNITLDRYYEPFTKTEFKGEFIEEDGDNRIYGKRSFYLTIPEVDSKLWKRLPFIWYEGYSSDGIIDPSRHGDYDLILYPNSRYWQDWINPSKKHYDFSEAFERFRNDFNELKYDKLYQSKLKEYFEELRRKSKQLPPQKPEVHRNPEDVIDNFLEKC